MANALGQLFVELGIDSAKFKSGLDRASRDLNSFEAQMKKTQRSVQAAAGMIQGAVLAFAGSAVVGAMKNAVNAYADAEKAVVDLGSALQSTGRMSQETLEQIRSSAANLQKTTVFDDDAIVQSTATLAQFAKQLSGSDLVKGQQVIVGLAHVMKVDLNTAAMQLGKAINGSSDAIGRSGIKIQGAKTEHERLAQAVQKTSSMFNAAGAAAQTTAGQIEIAKNQVGELNESFGQIVVAILDTDNKTGEFTSSLIKLNENIDANKQNIVSFARGILAAGSVVLEGGASIMSGIEGIVNGTIAVVQKAISIAIGGLNTLISIYIQNLNKGIGQTNGLLKSLKIPFQIPGLAIQHSPNNAKFEADFFWKQSQKSFGDARKHMQNIGNNFAGVSSPVNFAIKIPQGGGGFGAGGDGSGGAGGKGKKAGKSEAVKDLEEWKKKAEELRKESQTFWDKYEQDVKTADELLKRHLITVGEHDKRLQQLGDTIKNHIKVEGLKEALDSFMEPFKKTLDELGGSLSGEAFNQNFTDAQQVIESTRTSLETYNLQVEKLNRLYQEGFLSQEQWKNGMKQAKEAMDEAKGQSAEFAQALGNVISEFGDKFFSTMVEGFKTGKFAFKDMVASMLEDLAKLIFKMTVTIPIAKALEAALGGNSSKSSSGSGTGGAAVKAGTSILGAIFKKLFHFADGGVTPIGQPFMVGERGPEIMMANQSMRVIPNHQIGGASGAVGGGPAIHVTNVFQISTGVQQTVRAELAAMMPGIEKRTKDGVITAIKRGGTMTAAVGMKA